MWVVPERRGVVERVVVGGVLGCLRGGGFSGVEAVGVSVAGTNEQRVAIQALGWCPGPVVFLLQLYVLIFYKQLGHIWVSVCCPK